MSICANAIPLSLYIHMPWCVRKCPYCDFNSHALQGELPESAYVKRLIDELALQSQLLHIQNRPIHTIFIGGGTPSLISPKAYTLLLDAALRLFNIDSQTEITLEANPGTAEQHYFHGYRALGINRLSLGVQSFQSEKLKSLGHIHDGTEANRAIEIAHHAGFDNINIDLMYGLPKQTIDDAMHDLTAAMAWAPTHLSWYQLTMEPNTYFYKHPPRLPHDETIWRMTVAGKALLSQHHFHQYEVSAFARDNYYCRHNVNYWEFGDYLGIGAGAHSKITLDNGTVLRIENVKSPRNYLDPDKPMIAEKKVLSMQALSFEFMLNALRLQKPIPYHLFTTRTGLPLKHIEQPLTLAKDYQFLAPDPDHFVLTPLGTQFLNDVVELFLTDH